MFANSLALVDEAGLDYLHVFPYSARPGTPAARMPQLSGTLVKERAARLREAGKAATTKSLASRIGTTAQIVVERSLDKVAGDKGAGFGHSEHYAPVTFAGDAAIGSVIDIAITEATPDMLIGHAA